MSIRGPKILTALLLAAGAAALSGCVAYEPYPAYREPVVVSPPPVYAVPPPVVVGPGYYYHRPWHDRWYGPGRGWGGPRGWR
ncbi:hypothetical protein [Azospirillum sp. B510]|uniref:hypothetical protein n=1 Tax=Azospirillum sp. (strain B510) TaxID=137722 RepID=UPI0018D2B799|nr:hypothetical protein [Azospirillum sp. B510]